MPPKWQYLGMTGFLPPTILSQEVVCQLVIWVGLMICLTIQTSRSITHLLVWKFKQLTSYCTESEQSSRCTHLHIFTLYFSFSPISSCDPKINQQLCLSMWTTKQKWGLSKILKYTLTKEENVWRKKKWNNMHEELTSLCAYFHRIGFSLVTNLNPHDRRK